MSKTFYSTKTYNHSIGLSSCFRQWRADSHCKFLHGYSLEVKIVFKELKGLDERNWVIDFGGLKDVKQWLEDTFDHKTIIAKDDPEINTFINLQNIGIIDLIVLDNVGCEKFAEYIYDFLGNWLNTKNYDANIMVESVEVKEHSGNSAICSSR